MTPRSKGVGWLCAEHLRTYRDQARGDPGRSQGAVARPPRRRSAARHDPRARRRGRPRAPGERRRLPGPLVHRVGRQRLAAPLPGHLRPHRRRDAAGRAPQPGGPGVRGGPGRRRRGLRRGALRPRAAPRRGAHPRGGGPRRAGRVGPGDGIHPAADRRTPAADRDAPPGTLPGDRGARGRAPRRRRGRVRHRRRGGRLSTHAAPRRVRVPPARERALHDPRRRGVRAALDLAGDPVVRRGPPRPRRPDHRRHHDGR